MYARQSKASDIALKDINKALIIQFETFMKVDKNLCQNTVIRYMKCFKKIINIGLGNGWIKINPFLGIKFREEKVKKDVLTMDEVMRIYNKEFSIPRLERTRDIFVFCCWTGLAFIDVHDLHESDFFVDSNGNKWIIRNRIKTGVEAIIPVSKIPCEILEKYKNDKISIAKEKVLPVDTNQRMNSYLKEIADVCGINKKLTTHTARHTFATLLIADHASIKNVAAMMGHSSVKMTERYARVQDYSILYDMEKFSKNI
ncbi:site-specific integrase [Parabacteroides sp. W1-Q-101]|nr:MULTISPECIES: site-specific integrase [Bacteria]MCM0717707.1 site-specific integrase [Parabacteroides sp. W1-Q-101]